MKEIFMDENENIKYKGEVVATYEQVIDYICGGGELLKGFYQVQDGIIEVCGEDEEYEIVFIKNIKIKNIENYKTAS